MPREDAEQSFAAALDLLAEGLAQLVIEDARAEVAARLGVAPEQIDREERELDGADQAWREALGERGVA